MEKLQAKPSDTEAYRTYRTMRILFFLESLQGGGKERRAAELISYLNEQRGEYEIELILTEDDIHYEDVIKTGIRITILKRKGFKYDPRIFLGFYKICRRFRPDLIHTWGKMATFYAIPAKSILGIPIVSNLIADTIKGYGRFSKYALLLKTNVFFSDVVLANSRAGLDTYRVDPSKSRVIYNGVRLSRFNADFDNSGLRENLGIRTKFVVVMVATFSEFKDYDLFVDTARETGRRRNDVTFVAVGDGPELTRIKARLKNENVNNVILAGRLKNVEQIVSAADIGLLCTKSEGFSNSIIEYMALGKPVIASDVHGGSKELIKDGVTGYCTPRDPIIIADLTDKLLNDQSLRLSMGRKGKERIEMNFSIDRMGEEFRSLYNEVLALKNPGKSVKVEKKAI